MKEAFLDQMKGMLAQDQWEIDGQVIRVYPDDVSQLSGLLKKAGESQISIEVAKKYGAAATKIEGLLIDLGRMNKLLEIDKENVTATVQSGMVLADFQKALEEEGFYFPPLSFWDRDSYLAAAMAENAIGLNSAKYGRWREFTLGMEIMLSDGEVMEVGGKVIKYVSGLDFMGLMVGSKHSLGIVTKMVVRLLPQPEARRLTLSVFDSLTEAVQASESLLQRGLTPARNEVLTAKLAQKIHEDIKEGQILVMTEVEGFSPSMERQTEEIKVVGKKFGLVDFKAITDAADIAACWERYFEATLSLTKAPHFSLTMLPTEQAKFMDGLQRIAKEYGVTTEMVVHSFLVNVEVFALGVEGKAKDEFVEALKKLLRGLGGKISCEKIGIGDHIAITNRLEEGLKGLFDPKQILASKEVGC